MTLSAKILFPMANLSFQNVLLPQKIFYLTHSKTVEDAKKVGLNLSTISDLRAIPQYENNVFLSEKEIELKELAHLKKFRELRHHHFDLVLKMNAF